MKKEKGESSGEISMTTGYSEKSLIDKLRIREGSKIAVLALPRNYIEVPGGLRENAVITQGPKVR
jgi:hypothetical protein